MPLKEGLYCPSDRHPTCLFGPAASRLSKIEINSPLACQWLTLDTCAHEYVTSWAANLAFRYIGPLYSLRPLLQCRIVSLATIHQSRRVLHDAVLSQYCDIQSVSLSIPSCLLFFSRVTHLSIHKVLHAHYCVEHMLLPVAYACDAICMQDWLEQIAFVCFVSLPPRGTRKEEREGWLPRRAGGLKEDVKGG